MLFVLLVIAFQAPVSFFQKAVDTAVYLSFFQEAISHADTQTVTLTGTLNGEAPHEFAHLSTADSLGITAQETHSIEQIAALCQADVKSFDVRMRAVTFEARIRSVRDDQPSESLEAQLKELGVQRAALIARYVDQMKTSLGGEVFKRVDDYVRAHATGGFFPNLSEPKKKL